MDKADSSEIAPTSPSRNARADASKSAAFGASLPPQSFEAEQSVLGGLMLSNDAWDMVSSLLQATDFYQKEHQPIFDAIARLAKRDKPFDAVTVSNELNVMNKLEDAGGEVYLFELANTTFSVANIKAYAEIVRERSVLRQLVKVSQTIAESAFKPDGRQVVELLDEAERKVFAIAEQNARDGGPVSINTLLASAMERVDQLFHSNTSITGLSTGFADFDKMTSGLQPADLIIVAGRPSMGKTILGGNFAENAAIKSGLPVLFFSMEMPGEAIAMRLLSSLGRVNQHNLRTGQLTDQDWPRLTSAVNLLQNDAFYVDDTPGLTPSEVRARARRLAKQKGQLGLIVVDYLQLMRVPGFGAEHRTAEISEISRSLKALAKELSVPVIAISQLNRSLEQRADRRPVMSDIRESGAIEQDADLIVFIYRDEVYNPETLDKGIAEILIAKHRNGPTGKIKLAFLGEFMRFENLARE